MIKTLGTTIDWKSPDRALNIASKIKIGVHINGIYNIPKELRGKN